MKSNDWVLEEFQEVGRTFYAGDAERLRTLLTANPQYLYHESGEPAWQFSAAQDGWQDGLEILFTVGIGINDPDGEPDHEFVHPEGPVLTAATFGHADLVRWLLEKGAKINFEVHGQHRCLPLIRAANRGYLDIVKVLVEYGADVHGVWRGPNRDKIPTNAITEAADWGHTEVVDYLKSLGAQDVRETEPPDEKAHQRILHAMRHDGKLAEWSQSLATDPAVTIHMRLADEEIPFHRLFTVGLSDKRLPTPLHPYATHEIELLLPQTWPVTPEALASEEWGWPVQCLTSIVSHLLTLSEWPAEPVILENVGTELLRARTSFHGWFSVRNENVAVYLLDARIVTVWPMFAVYADEIEHARQHGHRAIIDLFEESDTPFELSPNRASVVAR